METLDILWPDLMPNNTVLSPKEILKQQAAELGKKTKNLLTADITSSVTRDILETDHVLLTFRIEAPLLNYWFDLFTVKHDILRIYPVFINNSEKASDEEEFKTLLKKLFSKPETIAKLQSLIAQSK
jgi:hypothetical protein